MRDPEQAADDAAIAAVLPDLEAGLAHHQAGRLDEAEALYAKVLQAVPDLGDALHLLGQIELMRGQADSAIALIGRAIEQLPKELAEPHFNLGSAFAAAGRNIEAETSFRKAIAAKPDIALAHSRLAQLLNLRGAFTEAAASSHKALDIDPALVEAQASLALALRGLRRFAEAETVLREVLVHRPDDATLLSELGTVLRELRRYEEALRCHERAVALAPDSAPARCAYGGTLWLAGQVREAAAQFRHAIELAPRAAEAWLMAGTTERALGQFDAAARCFRRALELAPGMTDARWALTAIGAVRSETAEAETLRATLADSQREPMARISAGFALGKLMDDADRYDEAFALFAAANQEFRRLRAESGEVFDATAFVDQVRGTIAATSADTLAQLGTSGNGSELPVFIVGMPRSGTTLVEQIAASHSRVFGAGELPHIREMLRDLEGIGDRVEVARWDVGRARALAEQHVARLRAMGSGAVRVIDKLPDNVLVLDQIAALFPRARVIYVMRDPCDCCLSNFFQFYTLGNLFACRLEDCGVRARETALLARHWLDVLPLQIMTIGYEALVTDLVGESRRLIDFLGLEWEPACLEFHRTERPVASASSWQVRQPLYARSVGRWRHYRRHLGPLLSALRG